MSEMKYIGVLADGIKVKISSDSPNRRIVISGISGTGKSVRIYDLENQIVAGGSTVIALDLDGSHPVLSGEENTISAREDGIALKFLNAEMLKKSAHETEMYISEVTDLLLSATKAGDRQKGILRNAISWALKNRQYFESDFEAIEAGLEEIGTEKALGVRDKIWPLLKCNVFRESKKEIQKGKLNIISLEGLDPDLKVVISEILLKNLWKEALIVKENNITIVIDEFQHLLLNKKAMLVQLLTEGRKYGLDVILATQSLARFTNDTLVALNQAAVRLYFRPALNETKKLALQIDSVNVERTMLMLKQLKIGESVAVGNLEFSGRHMTRPIVIKTNYKEKLAPSIRRL